MSTRSIDLPGGASPPVLSEVEYEIQQIRQRPTRNIPFVSTSVGILLCTGPGILSGISVRERSTGVQSFAYVTGSSANAAAANNVALPAGAGTSLNWITGFSVTGAGATAASEVLVTLTGVVSGTMNYVISIPAGATTGITPLTVNFGYPGLPAALQGSAITLNVPSFGAGNTNAAAEIHGYLVSNSTAGGLGANLPATLFELNDNLEGNLSPLPIAMLPLIPGGGINMSMGSDGPVFYRGLFMNPIVGTIKGSVWVKL